MNEKSLSLKKLSACGESGSEGKEIRQSGLSVEYLKFEA